jgi:glycosyltransferase involved in cell wall biosynthesis
MDKNINTKVSVIIPCYNAELYLETAVLSIINQTYRNLEIICIDDCSTDDTLVILNKLSKIDDRLIVVSNSVNLKLIKTLNLGIHLSTGKYIARMDSDDFSANDRIEKQLKYLEENDLDVCGTFTYYYYENRKRSIIKKIHFLTQSKSLELNSLFDSPLIHPSVLGKTNVFKQFMYGDNPKSYLIEDLDIWCRMFKNNVKIGVLPKYLFFYRINNLGESMTKREIQNKNKLSLSAENIFEMTGLSLSTNSISLISGIEIKDKIKLDMVKECIKHLNLIFVNFVTNQKLAPKEINELKTWLNHKLFYIYIISFKRGDLKSKLFSLVHLLFKMPLVLVYFYYFILNPFFISFSNKKILIN